METIVTPQNFQIQVVVKGPAAVETELVACGFFTLIENEVLIGGAKLLNEALNGKVMEYRINESFKGNVGELFLFKPQENTIPAKQVLLMGLGKREEISLEVVHSVAMISMEKANQLGVTNFAFAPEIRDAGVTAFGAKEVAQAASSGILQRYKELIKTGTVKVTDCFMLAGSAHEADARQGIQLAAQNAASLV